MVIEIALLFVPTAYSMIFAVGSGINSHINYPDIWENNQKAIIEQKPVFDNAKKGLYDIWFARKSQRLWMRNSRISHLRIAKEKRQTARRKPINVRICLTNRRLFHRQSLFIDFHRIIRIMRGRGPAWLAINRFRLFLRIGKNCLTYSNGKYIIEQCECFSI